MRRANSVPTASASRSGSARETRSHAPRPSGAIHLLFCCDPGYFPYLATTLASLLESNRANPLVVHLALSRRDLAAEARLSAWFAAAGTATLEIHEFDWGDTLWHTSFHISQDAYIRLFAGRLLGPSLDKVLYLDADLLVLDDLRPLWETDISGHALAAVPDPYGADRRQALGLPEAATYVNSGVLLMNLVRWRRERLETRLSAYVGRMGEMLLFHDQDAINGVLHDEILVLDYRWNLQARMLRRPRKMTLPDRAAIARAARSPAVIHYTSARKPWLFVMATPAKALYRRYLRRTPWGGLRPPDQRISRVPEFLLNHLLYAMGSDYTWDRVRRATTVGRGIDRVAGRLAHPTFRTPAAG
jgi:lipopolysaccharide biosynthesis glycosyltransferase